MGMDNPAAVRAVGAFGGGIAGSGNVCGILLGGIALLSNMYSRAALSEKEDPRMWLLSKKFMRQFEELAGPCGGINCADIARVDWTDRKAVKRYYKDPGSTRATCIRLVGDAAHALALLLEQEEVGT